MMAENIWQRCKDGRGMGGVWVLHLDKLRQPSKSIEWEYWVRIGIGEKFEGIEGNSIFFW